MLYKLSLIAASAALLVLPDAAFASSNRLLIPTWYQCHRVKNSCQDRCVDTKTGQLITIRVC
jgi:hypothetical protein